MLALGDVTFEEDTNTRETAFYFLKENGKQQIAARVTYLENVFEDEECSPCIDIKLFETEATQVSQLVGQTFLVENIEMADERDDTFYLFESELFVEYKLMVLETTKNTVHIECIGTAVIDGYEDSYETAKFHMNCWLPVISSVSDWKKFGL